MRKQDYIQVHALLVEITRHLSDHGELSAVIPAEYDALDTRPTSVHESKRQHHESVMVLATAIEPWLEQAADEQQDVAVTGLQ